MGNTIFSCFEQKIEPIGFITKDNNFYFVSTKYHRKGNYSELIRILLDHKTSKSGFVIAGAHQG